MGDKRMAVTCDAANKISQLNLLKGHGGERLVFWNTRRIRNVSVS